MDASERSARRLALRALLLLLLLLLLLVCAVCGLLIVLQLEVVEAFRTLAHHVGTVSDVDRDRALRRAVLPLFVDRSLLQASSADSSS